MYRIAPYLATCLLGLTLATVSGCASLSGAPETETDTNPAKAGPGSEEQSESIHYADFEPEVLYQLLAAEIAAQRGHFDVTLANYMQAALTSRDEGIVARTLRIAQSLGADSVQQQMARLWLELDPDNVEAHRASAIQALKQQDMKTALLHLEKLMDQGEDANFDSLAAMAPSLAPEQQYEMLSLYQQLAQRHPNTPELEYSIALLHKVLDEPEPALSRLDDLLAEHPNFQPAILLKGDLLYQNGQRREALNYLTTNTRRFPASRPLGNLYGRMLLNENQLQAAQDEFQRLLTRYPNNPDLRLSHGLVALENNQPELAKEDLTHLVEQGHYVDQASYYLGRIEEDAGNPEQAITYYQSVEKGNFFFPALSRASNLQAEDGLLEPALEHIRILREEHPAQAERFRMVEVNLLLEHDSPERALNATNSALEDHPDNIEIRYSRAMLEDARGNLERAEQDLNYILEMQPENAVALNALGYILTVGSDRLDEARQYIEKALSLDPENPAILDSMGWVLYRQGDTEGALDYLADAWAAYPDPEVAAHYGEALWVTGNREQARIVWDQALEDHPEHEILQETINRLTRAGSDE